MSTDLEREGDFFRKKFLLSLIIPGTFVFLMWMVKLTEILFEIDLSGLGIYPLSLKGLPGIFFSPFVHGDFSHLFNNTLPLFFLSAGVFYFYSEVALRVFLGTWFLSGMLVWIGGREVWHVGSSGIIYGLATFLFFSGIIRKYYRLIALSLLIVFLYGSMVWGMVPDLYQNVSWESHMLGGFAGIALAVYYRNEGPQSPVYDWMDEDETEKDENDGEDSLFKAGKE